MVSSWKWKEEPVVDTENVVGLGGGEDGGEGGKAVRNEVDVYDEEVSRRIDGHC